MNAYHPSHYEQCLAFLALFVLGALFAVCLFGCDPTQTCTRHVTQDGMPYVVCAVNNGTSYIDTDYGAIDCVRDRHGLTDCDGTAELYLGTVRDCIDDMADAMYAYDGVL